ncbi:hypothetical protein ACJMK2_036391 [Sinanodonta woodiana]|uniref:Uncharacterized protein n=1 Tax=Sinanodonta woodiana TaxID=1069815 RepID=A0ABD3WHE3_SINWO
MAAELTPAMECMNSVPKYECKWHFDNQNQKMCCVGNICSTNIEHYSALMFKTFKYTLHHQLVTYMQNISNTVIPEHLRKITILRIKYDFKQDFEVYGQWKRKL